MAQPPLIMPALRGTFGDWIFYSCLMPVTEIGARAHFAKDIHQSKALSDLIQRSLEGPRARQIANYLATAEERFFNSLVLATYGGSPEWLELGDFQSKTRPELLSQISDTAMDIVGFLRLTGAERIFALDGQHRLAGIQKALKDGRTFEDEQLSVNLVGHKTTKVGLQRTRRLFTTLNKTAIPVRKADIIALDEDDAMAIVVRRLVENHTWFKDPKIAIIASPNVPVANRTCLTTISNLYDILKLIFMHLVKKGPDRLARSNRPSEERLAEFERIAVEYMGAIGDSFRQVGRVFESRDPAPTTRRNRGPEGGHLLFRPIGLEIFTRIAIELAAEQNSPLPAVVGALRHIPVDLSEPPYAGVIWDTARHTMIPGGKRIAADLLRHMIGRFTGDEDNLLANYKRALGRGPDDRRVRLPKRIGIA